MVRFRSLLIVRVTKFNYLLEMMWKLFEKRHIYNCWWVLLLFLWCTAIDSIGFHTGFRYLCVNSKIHIFLLAIAAAHIEIVPSRWVQSQQCKLLPSESRTFYSQDILKLKWRLQKYKVLSLTLLSRSIAIKKLGYDPLKKYF